MNSVAVQTYHSKDGKKTSVVRYDNNTGDWSAVHHENGSQKVVKANDGGHAHSLSRTFVKESIRSVYEDVPMNSTGSAVAGTTGEPPVGRGAKLTNILRRKNLKEENKYYPIKQTKDNTGNYEVNGKTFKSRIDARKHRDKLQSGNTVRVSELTPEFTRKK